uniref:Growth factor receptor domain-containing protein n=1 Tax=Oryzias latipes TaxID=8090 RepID=A0A3P9LYF2_ORYLA
VEECPEGHTAWDRQCHQYCDDSCLTCSGSDDDACVLTVGSWLWFGTDGSCVDDCPAGYFKEESGQKCEPCHTSCQTCVGKNSLQCLTCKAHLFREAKECVETCQFGHYGNTVSRTCEKCDPSCSECTEGGEEDCLSCSSGLVYLRTEGRCLPSCPPGYHRDTAHQTCEPCHSSCKTCSGETICANKKIVCAVQHNLFVSADCDSSCLECRAAGPFNCTACPEQAILEEGGRCLPCCKHDDDDGGEDATAQHDCCNCTESRGQPRSHSV